MVGHASCAESVRMWSCSIDIPELFPRPLLFGVLLSPLLFSPLGKPLEPVRSSRYSDSVRSRESVLIVWKTLESANMTYGLTFPCSVPLLKYSNHMEPQRRPGPTPLPRLQNTDRVVGLSASRPRFSLLVAALALL